MNDICVAEHKFHLLTIAGIIKGWELKGVSFLGSENKMFDKNKT